MDHSPSDKKIAVLYLARKAEGLHPVLDFLHSYLAHPAGVPHDLVVIFKGFEGRADLEEIKSQFPAIPYLALEVSDEGFDLGSYYSAAEQLTHEYICCLNTFSKILETGWLSKFYSAISLPGVGLVGATGSYESTHTWMTLIQKALWLSSYPLDNKKLKQGINKYFSFILPKTVIGASTSNYFIRSCKQFSSLFKSNVKYLLFLLKNSLKPVSVEDDYQTWWSKTQHIGDIAQFCKFPLFPNPHIRSNAFMIGRNRFLSLKRSPFITKYDACFFESGAESMTRQMLKAGLKVQIVGKNGVAYDLQNWHKSHTFRMGTQFNLLVADNQTMAFDRASFEMRVVNILSTWGEESISLPKDFPKMDLPSSRKSEAYGLTR